LALARCIRSRCSRSSFSRACRSSKSILESCAPASPPPIGSKDSFRFLLVSPPLLSAILDGGRRGEEYMVVRGRRVGGWVRVGGGRRKRKLRDSRGGWRAWLRFVCGLRGGRRACVTADTGRTRRGAGPDGQRQRGRMRVRLLHSHLLASKTQL
jgi:hypothetical protein